MAGQLIPRGKNVWLDPGVPYRDPQTQKKLSTTGRFTEPRRTLNV
ncbi:MAG: hypothetical protein U0Q18_00340 [Bryobacteraceae bacterium]